MDKTSKVIIYIIAAIILIMVGVEVAKPKPVSWRDSYSSSDTVPLGCYVFFNELSTLSNQKVTINNNNTYEFLKSTDSTVSKTVMLINNRLNLNTEVSKALLNFVNQGNTVFLSSKYVYSSVLKDTLKFGIKALKTNVFRTATTHRFTSKHLSDATTTFTDVIENNYFDTLDTLNTTIVGQLSYVEKDSTTLTKANLIKVPYGANKGQFIIHTNPYAFSNYHLLNGNDTYAAALLSYLPKQPIIWDDNYKSGRKVIQSPLRYILQNRALKWAFYTALFSLILFVVFKGKRTQRIIPIISPLKNDSVAFTKTMGQLYFQQRDFSTIITHKINYFLDHLRSQYYLDTSQLHANFIKKLALKSGNTPQQTTDLIDFILMLQQQKHHTETQLIRLHTKIKAFKTTKAHG